MLRKYELAVITHAKTMAYKSEYGSRSERGRTMKNRSGAWMSAMSNGRLYVGAW